MREQWTTPEHIPNVGTFRALKCPSCKWQSQPANGEQSPRVQLAAHREAEHK